MQLCTQATRKRPSALTSPEETHFFFLKHLLLCGVHSSTEWEPNTKFNWATRVAANYSETVVNVAVLKRSPRAASIAYTSAPDARYACSFDVVANSGWMNVFGATDAHAQTYMRLSNDWNTQTFTAHAGLASVTPISAIVPSIWTQRALFVPVHFSEWPLWKMTIPAV